MVVGSAMSSSGVFLNCFSPPKHFITTTTRHVADAEVEEERLIAPACPEGRRRHPADLPVPAEPAIQLASVQARPVGGIHAGSLRPLAFGQD